MNMVNFTAGEEVEQAAEGGLYAILVVSKADRKNVSFEIMIALFVPRQRKEVIPLPGKEGPFSSRISRKVLKQPESFRGQVPTRHSYCRDGKHFEQPIQGLPSAGVMGVVDGDENEPLDVLPPLRHPTYVSTKRMTDHYQLTLRKQINHELQGRRLIELAPVS
mmetsp:Transcript_8995/g.12382  ORF Transcript_8995/g.12382 Transcript_8995/m.12382 type:complete len:163 (+) Transcript_8995:399-887(+)